MSVLVTYDVQDDRRRRKMAKALERAAARRVQRSVFLFDRDGATPDEARKTIEPQLAGDKEGLDVRILPLCASCRSRTLLFGDACEKDRRARGPYKIV